MAEARFSALQNLDVLIVGSGAAGMMAAIRAHDLGLSVAVIEKAAFYGGTTAYSSGGVWIAVNDEITATDNNDLAMTYLEGVTNGQSRSSMLRAYVENGPEMIRYAASLDVRFIAGLRFPDYYSELPGAIRGRSMLVGDRDGAALGDDFKTLHPSHPSTALHGRYAISSPIAAMFLKRLPGWKKALFKLVWDYWSDIGWRLKTRTDRKLTMGRSLIGGLRLAMKQQNIPLLLNTALDQIHQSDGKIVAATVKSSEDSARIAVKQAVILASGGFDQSQKMRNEYLTVPTQTGWSACPPRANDGAPIQMATELGASVEFMKHAWWCPVMIPPAKAGHAPVQYPLFFDRAKPGTICINRNGERFVNDALSYDMFGYAMVADQKATYQNTPCYMIFDSRFRKKYPAGALLPGWSMPDMIVPRAWWDKVVFKRNSIRDLADAISVPAATLERTIADVNRDAATGVDARFHRGETDFDKNAGDMGVKPNPSFGAIDRAPYYAVRVDLGDLGTRGGLRTDEAGAVLDEASQRIQGLYAVGDVAATIFGDTYPGGGCAIGPAMVFGYLAAADIARRKI